MEYTGIVRNGRKQNECSSTSLTICATFIANFQVPETNPGTQILSQIKSAHLRAIKTQRAEDLPGEVRHTSTTSKPINSLHLETPQSKV